MKAWGDLPQGYEMAVGRGQFPGQTVVTIRGHNDTVPNSAAFVDVADIGNLTYLASAERLSIVSSSTEDAPGGTGIGAILVMGVNDDGVSQTEAVTLAGQTPVLTTGSFLRTNFLLGVLPVVGSSTYNVGTITATAETALTVQQQMEPAAGISQGSQYTVPMGFTLAVTKVEINVAREGGGQDPLVEFRGYSRTSAAHPFIQVFDKRIDAGVQNEIPVPLPFPETQPTEGSDLVLRVSSDRPLTEVRTRLYGILIENDS